MAKKRSPPKRAKTRSAKKKDTVAASGAFASSAFQQSAFQTAPAKANEITNPSPANPQITPQTVALEARATLTAAVRSTLGATEPVNPEVSAAAAGVMEAVEAADGVHITGEVGPPDPNALYQEVLRRIELLEAVIADMPRQPGIGHNGPPEYIEGVFDQRDHRDCEEAISVLASQSATTASPDVERAASTLRRISERLWEAVSLTAGYVAKKGDTLIDAAAKSSGTEIGKRLVQLPFWSMLGWALARVLNALESWLAALN